MLDMGKGSLMTYPVPPTISTALLEIRNGGLSPLDLVIACIARIKRLEPSIRAMTFLDTENVLTAAQASTDEISQGRRPAPLEGVAVVVKDIIDVKGLPTSANSTVHTSQVAGRDAAIVGRIRELGALILGKSATWEYAIGETALEGAFPRSRNPLDTTYETGGSSSGSAAAVAAGECQMALGTDTGGSTRCPAAWCGVTGFKPSVGLLPLDGVLPLSQSQDCLSLITRTAEDMRLVFGAVAEPGTGKDSDYTDIAGRLFVTWPRVARLSWGLAPEVEANFERVLELLCAAGANVQERSLPDIAVYDHVAVQISRKEGFDTHEMALQNAAWCDGLCASTRERLEIGSRITGAEIAVARTMRTKLVEETRAIMWDVDAVITPTMHCTAPRLAERAGLMSSGVPLMVRFANCIGIPSVTIPSGAGDGGLPFGLCLNARFGKDHDLLKLAELVAAELSRDPATTFCI